jgi:hypothetical protein
MTDQTGKLESKRKSRERPPPRPSYEKVAENIEKWANSSGLQKPTLPDEATGRQ